MQPSEPPEPSFSTIDEGVERFVQWMHKGMSAWHYAGRLLVELLKKDGKVFEKIIDRCPWIDTNCLWSLYHVGTKRYRPEVLMMNGHVGHWMRQVDYVDQCVILDHEIEIVVGEGKDGPLVKRRRVQELTPADCKILFASNHVRNVKEQHIWWRDQAVNQEPKHVIGWQPRALPPSQHNAAMRETSKPEKEEPHPLTVPPPGRKVYPIGTYRCVWKFGHPVFTKMTKESPKEAQRILMTPDMCGDLSAVLEFTQWRPT